MERFLRSFSSIEAIQASNWYRRIDHRWNRFVYDSEKFLDRIWNGTKGRDLVVQVPFMITQDMKSKLLSQGYPLHIITHLQPEKAHQLIETKIDYSNYILVESKRSSNGLPKEEASSSTSNNPEKSNVDNCSLTIAHPLVEDDINNKNTASIQSSYLVSSNQKSHV